MWSSIALSPNHNWFYRPFAVEYSMDGKRLYLFRWHRLFDALLSNGTSVLHFFNISKLKVCTPSGLKHKRLLSFWLSHATLITRTTEMLNQLCLIQFPPHTPASKRNALRSRACQERFAPLAR